MKNFISLFSLLFLCTLFFSSCKDKCKVCSAEVVQSLDGSELSTTSIGGIEYCEEALEAIEANLVQTVTQSAGGSTQSIVTTYTCN